MVGSCPVAASRDDRSGRLVGGCPVAASGDGSGPLIGGNIRAAAVERAGPVIDPVTGSGGRTATDLGATDTRTSGVRALLRWQRAAGPYWMYVCAAPFLTTEPLALGSTRTRRPDPALLALLERLAEPATALFVDLPAPSTLAAAPALSALGVAVVPVIQRWCAPRAVLPARPLLGRLVAAAEQVARPRAGAPALFVLDGERAGRRGLRPPAHRFDNRYEYPGCRLPPPGLLRREGVDRVLWLSRGGVAADLLDYARRLAAAGLAPGVVDARRPRGRPGA